MEYEKMLYYATATSPETTSTTATATATATTTNNNNTNSNNTMQMLQTQISKQYLPETEQYAAYAENFDLSLLPQDNIIPTTVYQYNNNKIVSPQIKIEQTWGNLLDNIKQEQPYSLNYEQTQQQQQQHFEQQQQQQQQQQQHQQQVQQQFPPTYAKGNNQLIPPSSLPPPAYPHIYPSPQSSPAQSDYAASFIGGQFNGCYDSLSSSRTSLYASSPCPSLDTSCIKQELHILPPSPPESNCETPSPRSSCNETIKTEPFDADVERLIDLNTLLLDKPYIGGKQEFINQPIQPQDHQVLREYLEDTTFQKKHNLKPLALESFIGGLAEVRGDFEPVISLALEHVKREADAICAELQISQDPSAWTPSQVHAWLRSTMNQFKLPQCNSLESKFCENGAALLLLSEEEFMHRLPESGSTLHAQLEIWKMAYTDVGYHYQQQYQTHQPHQPHQQQQQQSNVIQSSTLNGNQMTASLQQMQQQQQQQKQQQHQHQQQLSTPHDLWSENYMEIDLNEDSEDEEADLPPPIANNLNPVAQSATINGTSLSNTGTTTNVPITTPITAIAIASTSTTTTTTTPTTNAIKRPGGTRNGGSHIHLWQFLKELLAAPHVNGTAIRWIDRSKGIFKIEDSVRVAKLWGRRKNRPAMNYDKLSRSIRQYYKKGIMKKTERSQRLVYQFCHPYHQ